MILASACLVGENCRYNGKNKLHPLLKKINEKKKVICVCPEVLGGLPVPRPPCEIEGGNAQLVLARKAKVVNAKQEDITEDILKGCHKALDIAKENNVKLAILKDKSVCCAVDSLHDGSFSSKLVNGKGILTTLLQERNIKVVNSDRLVAFPIDK